MKKRGQVTSFIILGLVIVIILALGIYYRSAILRELSKIELIKGVAVPEEIRPVKDYVDNCILDSAKEGVIIMGSQGGYINIKKDDIALSRANIFSNALAIFPGQDFVVPYWFYQTANGIFKNNVPSLKDMQDELDLYINEEFKSCLNNFSEFKDYDISYGDSKAETEIKKEKVNVKMIFPIRIKFENTEVRLNEFDITIDAALGKLYSIAKQLIDAENQNNFLEEFTIDAMVVYDQIPFSDTEVSCKPKIWSKTSVIKDLKGILQQNIPFIKVKGLDYDLLKNHKYFEWKNALSGSYRKVHANLLYMPNWPFFLSVIPADGELLKSNQLTERLGSDVTKFLASLFCLTDYHFVYDIKYPVLLTLKDDRSFSGDGYIFQFAYQVIIDNNQAKVNELGTVDIPETGKNICEFANSKFSVLTLEDATPLANADVSYKCITTICDIGKTDKNGMLTANFPRCINGAVIAEKDGFHRGKAIVSTNKEGSVTVELKPYYDLGLNIKVIQQKARDPTSREQVIFELSNVEDEYATTVMYPESKKIRLIPGTYKVSSYVIEESPFEVTIEGKSIESCTKVPVGILGIFGITETKCQTIDIPSSTLSQVVKGGAEFEFTVDELENIKSITLYTVADKTPSTYDELNLIYDKIKGNALRSDFIYPELR